MGKGTISKKKKAPSLHSRVARRATSPGIDTDKSLKNVQPPPESIDHRPSVLSIHHGAGVSKKQKKGRNMSSKARKRYEKAQDRAAAVLERTEKKVALSKGQSRVIQDRRKVWDAINQDIPLEKNTTAATGKALLGAIDTDESEFDDEMAEMVEIGEGPRNQPSTVNTSSFTQPMESRMDQDGEDGIA